MPINSRTKGATFEREVAKILNEFFESEGIDYTCKRNLDQYQSKDLCDINMPYHASRVQVLQRGRLVSERMVGSSLQINRRSHTSFNF